MRAAAKLARLEGTPRLAWIEAAPGRLQRLLERIATTAHSSFGVDWDLPAAATALGMLPEPVAKDVAQDLGWLVRGTSRSQPFAAVVHCLCEAP